MFEICSDRWFRFPFRKPRLARFDGAHMLRACLIERADEDKRQQAEARLTAGRRDP
jgi:hypothetical protein